MQPLSDTGPASSLTDANILRGIRPQDRQRLAEVYRQYFPLLRAWICRNQGDEEAARDIFQEAMLVIFEQVQDEAFAFTHSFRAYLMDIGAISGRYSCGEALPSNCRPATKVVLT